MGWSEYARSKMPLKLVFIVLAALLVNMTIVEVFKLALWFRYEEPADVSALAQMNEAFEGAVLLDTAQNESADPFWVGEYTAYLLETANGDRKLAVVEKHFLFDRYRYLEKFEADVPNQEGLHPTSSGTLYHQTLCWILDGVSFESFSMGQNYGPDLSLAIIPMIIAEYIAYCLLFKREELL